MRRFIAAGFGVGLLPRRVRGSDSGAGTLGAVVAAGVALAIISLPLWAHLAAVAAAIALSLWAPRPFLTDDHDPGWVAIDEVAGALLAVTGLTGGAWAVAWLVARAADIWKVLPGTRQAERLPGSAGVTADDLVAGLYGLGAGWLMTGLL
jgi:phosphatidylglycerophosphatase A